MMAMNSLRRLTFCQQQQKVSKKCRPSSAREADFPQIASEDAHDYLAYERQRKNKLGRWTESAREMGDGLAWVLVALVMVWGMGCGGGVGQVRVDEVWVRENISPQKMTAGYMVVRNNGAMTSLVAAETDVAEVTELHVMTVNENVMQMRKVEKIPIPEGGVTTLQPGGNHLMLIGLKRDLKRDEKVGVTLHFENGQTLNVEAVVRAMGQ